MQCSQELFFSLLSPLTEPVELGEPKKHWLRWLCERREERKRAFVNSA
jgi:hypothetical protein